MLMWNNWLYIFWWINLIEKLKCDMPQEWFKFFVIFNCSEYWIFFIIFKKAHPNSKNSPYAAKNSACFMKIKKSYPSLTCHWMATTRSFNGSFDERWNCSQVGVQLIKLRNMIYDYLCQSTSPSCLSTWEWSQFTFNSPHVQKLW